MSQEDLTLGNTGEKQSENTSSNTPKFLKRILLNSKKYRAKIDILSVILKDDGAYSAEEVDDMLEKFLKKEIKRAKNK